MPRRATRRPNRRPRKHRASRRASKRSLARKRPTRHPRASKTRRRVRRQRMTGAGPIPDPVIHAPAPAPPPLGAAERNALEMEAVDLQGQIFQASEWLAGLNDNDPSQEEARNVIENEQTIAKNRLRVVYGRLGVPHDEIDALIVEAED